MKTEVKNLYSKRAEERRRQFNKLINSCDMVLLNSAPEIDEELYYSDNWLGESPFNNTLFERARDIRESLESENISTAELAELEEIASDLGITVIDEMLAKDILDEIDNTEEYIEIYQWFAVGSSDAEFLAKHGQYVTYSNVLDVHLLAICHFGTSWDYVDSMVEAFSDCYTGLEDFNDNKE